MPAHTFYNEIFDRCLADPALADIDVAILRRELGRFSERWLIKVRELVAFGGRADLTSRVVEVIAARCEALIAEAAAGNIQLIGKDNKTLPSTDLIGAKVLKLAPGTVLSLADGSSVWVTHMTFPAGAEAASIERPASLAVQLRQRRDTAILSALNAGRQPGSTESWKDFTDWVAAQCGVTPEHRGFSERRIKERVEQLRPEF
jgi:hypothetical protein